MNISCTDNIHSRLTSFQMGKLTFGQWGKGLILYQTWSAGRFHKIFIALQSQTEVTCLLSTHLKPLVSTNLKYK